MLPYNIIFVTMSKVIKISKGLDIKLVGKAEKIYQKAETTEFYAIKPTDFPGLTAKLVVKEGDKVKAGTTLFFDKYLPEVKFSSPVSGEVAEVRRGDRRKLLEIVVKADSEVQHEDFGKADPASLSREDILSKILNSGLWPFFRQRPYAVVANPKDTPKCIFIPGFDSAPMAPDYDFVMKERGNDFQNGINVLKMLTTGKIHLTLNAEFATSDIFANAKGVEITKFSGPHPAGSVGVQIHHIDPINKGDIVWYIYPQEVAALGKLFAEGIYDSSKIVALTGSEVNKPMYFKTRIGSRIDSIHQNKVTQGELRFISGNVLTGTRVEKDGFLGFYDSQITIIPEGNHSEFLGWVLPGFKKFSVSRSYWSWLSPGKERKLHTNLNGGERAFVFTGQYEKVVPMDILPVYLLKAILVKDIDRMEELGIYEVAEEDFALCEVICTSKVNAQQIIRDGINIMIKELG